jgi:xylulokinase
VPYLAGLDVGTTGTRAVVIAEDGTVRGVGTSEYPLVTPRPGWAEQDPEEWWRGARESLQQAVHRAGARPEEVAALGLSGQMHSLVLMDAAGRVLRPAILWNDQRNALECAEMTDRVGRERLLAITRNQALPGFTAPKILWVRRHEPDIFRRAAAVLLPKDYVRYRLTGTRATEVSDASGTALLDVPRRTWSSEILRALDIPEGWLPRCAESPEITATVMRESAEGTGLRAGLPVVGGGGDQAAQAVGTGVVQPGRVAVTLGTSGVVFTPLPDPAMDPEARTHTFCHAVPGRWHVMGVMLSAGGALRWFRDTLAPGADYDRLGEAASRVPPGSERLVFLPYLSGERTPHADPLARGAFVGLSLAHGLGHLVRAVMEGVAFGLRDSVEILRGMGLDVTQVRVSGGGARSAVWRQILADVLQAEVVTVNVTEGAAYGAALLAGVGSGVYPSVDAACDGTVRVTTRTEPVEAHRAVYEDLYAVYRALYPALSPAFRQLAEGR